MIPQPQLGALLINLRKKKGWTQEELVEQCHVSVRTIQRIESGEVTPRSATIKLLLAALDYDPQDWKEFDQKEQKDRSLFKPVKAMLLLNLSDDQIKKSFQDAWIGGIVFLLMFTLDIAVEFILTEHLELIGKLTYCSVKVATIGSFFIFMRGFLALSKLFENEILKISVLLYIGTMILLYLGDMVIMLFYPEILELDMVFGGAFLIVNGAVGVVFGVGLIRLQDGMGRSARYAGALEIITGICMMTVLLAPLALVLFAPAVILEIFILSKADELSQKGKI